MKLARISSVVVLVVFLTQLPVFGQNEHPITTAIVYQSEPNFEVSASAIIIGVQRDIVSEAHLTADEALLDSSAWNGNINLSGSASLPWWITIPGNPPGEAFRLGITFRVKKVSIVTDELESIFLPTASELKATFVWTDVEYYTLPGGWPILTVNFGFMLENPGNGKCMAFVDIFDFGTGVWANGAITTQEMPNHRTKYIKINKEFGGAAALDYFGPGDVVNLRVRIVCDGNEVSSTEFGFEDGVLQE